MRRSRADELPDQSGAPSAADRRSLLARARRYATGWGRHGRGSALHAATAADADWEIRALAPTERAIIDEVRPYTLTTTPRILATIDAVTHVIHRGVEGALVEWGVWKGGQVLAMVRVLQALGAGDRHLYLFDTFEGMTEPTEADVSPFDEPALVTWHQSQLAGRKPWDWAFNDKAFSERQVKEVIRSTDYPADQVHFVVGRVEDTIPREAPRSIAFLRLDTDWYQSTRHELDHLYPRLATGGVLIIDDYGHWEGARQAVDEYFLLNGSRPLLSRLDYTGRMGVKP